MRDALHYEAFAQTLINRELPIGLGPLNPAGVQTAGMDLNKKNLLKDATAALYGLPATAVPDEVLAAIPKGVNTGWKLLQSYLTAGTYNWTAPDLFGGKKTYGVGVMVIGGGGSGGYGQYAAGGGSGFTVSFILTVTPGKVYKAVVGAGGVGTPYSSAGGPGANGGASSFNGVAAAGGSGGAATTSPSLIIGANGAQPSCGQGGLKVVPFGGQLVGTSNTNGYFLSVLGAPMQCFNPFECRRILGAGGGVRDNRKPDPVNMPSGKDPVTGKGGGAAGENGGKPADDNGCGGGAAVGTSGSSGAGGDGAVKLYVRRMSA